MSNPKLLRPSLQAWMRPSEWKFPVNMPDVSRIVKSTRKKLSLCAKLSKSMRARSRREIFAIYCPSIRWSALVP
jgi:hypothetical protein